MQSARLQTGSDLTLFGRAQAKVKAVEAKSKNKFSSFVIIATFDPLGVLRSLLNGNFEKLIKSAKNQFTAI